MSYKKKRYTTYDAHKQKPPYNGYKGGYKRKKTNTKSSSLLSKIVYLALIALIICGINYAKDYITDMAGHYQDVEISQEDAEKQGLYYDWDESLAPEYYYVIGKANVEDELPAGKIRTSSIDSKGRTHGVTATVTYEMVEESKGWREDFGPEDDPSGWGHNEEVSIELPNGKYYNGWFWNRSHLLADSLGGHADRDNVITGTRTQNVGSNNQKHPGGMTYTETKARNWLYNNHDGTVYYSATPIYKDKEVIPRSVVVNVKSSDGSIDECVIVYNYAKGYEIDYNTGEFYRK